MLEGYGMVSSESRVFFKFVSCDRAAGLGGASIPTCVIGLRLGVCWGDRRL